MPLAAGDRLGPYEIEAPVASGGMGEVYRAVDTRLDRRVAVKIIGGTRARDATRRERFEREARAVAALNHPHICTLFDVGQSGEMSYLVMEYLEGETLAARLARGASTSGTSASALKPGSTAAGTRPGLPVEVALRHAIQIADALDKAHRQGLIHRDVKPSNIMLTRSGVKLLDFGLVRADESHSGDAVETQSPPDDRSRQATAAEALTGDGSVLGTLNYMAPEQVEGRTSDARTDIFALATVIYEMVTGRRPFEGRSQATVIAAILTQEPDPMALHQPAVPAALDRLVRQCLAKDPDERWQSAGDVRRELEAIAEAGIHTSYTRGLPRGSSLRARALIAGLAVALAAATAAAVVGWTRSRPTPRQRLHLQLATGDLRDFYSVSFAPDGRRVAYVSRDAAGAELLTIRSLDSPMATTLPGTQGARATFWSPDGLHVGFHAFGTWKRVPAAGGLVQPICELGGRALGGSWGTAGTILLTMAGQPLWRVPEGGGAPTGAVAGPSQRVGGRPAFLRDGRRFLYLALGQRSAHTLHLADLDGTPPRALMQASSGADLAADGFVLYADGAVLKARAFDDRTAALLGEPITVVNEVTTEWPIGLAAFAASGAGSLVFRPRVPIREQFTWFDRQGKRLGELGTVDKHDSFDLSDDGQRIVFATIDLYTGDASLSQTDARTGVTSRIPLPGDVQPNDPVFSPDGKSIAYTAGQRGILRQSVNGGETATLFADPKLSPHLEAWSRDGRWIAFHLNGHAGGHQAAVIEAHGRAPPMFFGDDAAEIDEMRFSADGRWLAYSAESSSRWEVYVTRVPPTGERWQVSASGGMQPRWRADGKELYYVTPDATLMAVPVSAGATFTSGAPQPLFKLQVRASPYNDQYTAAADGERFLVDVLVEPPETTPLHLMTNWTSGLDDPR